MVSCFHSPIGRRRHPGVHGKTSEVRTTGTTLDNENLNNGHSGIVIVLFVYYRNIELGISGGCLQYVALTLFNSTFPFTAARDLGSLSTRVPTTRGLSHVRQCVTWLHLPCFLP
jgi:hypothetical protein